MRNTFTKFICPHTHLYYDLSQSAVGVLTCNTCKQRYFNLEALPKTTRFVSGLLVQSDFIDTSKNMEMLRNYERKRMMEHNSEVFKREVERGLHGDYPEDMLTTNNAAFRIEPQFLEGLQIRTIENFVKIEEPQEEPVEEKQVEEPKPDTAGVEEFNAFRMNAKEDVVVIEIEARGTNREAILDDLRRQIAQHMGEVPYRISKINSLPAKAEHVIIECGSKTTVGMWMQEHEVVVRADISDHAGQ